LNVSRQSVKDVDGDVLIDGTKVSLSWSSPDDLFRHWLPILGVFF
jgi:hypothetical protein